MNQNLIAVETLDGAEAGGELTRQQVEAFKSSITREIQKKGFHIADADSLKALWPEILLMPIEKLQRVHAFATAHGWEVASKEKVSIVLFQPAGRRAILPGMWRLCGLN